MTDFIFIFLWVLSLFGILYQSKNIKYKSHTISGKMVCIIIISTALFVISGFRSLAVGNDTWNYATNVFQYVASYNDIIDLLYDDELTGKGYWVIFYLFSSISKSPQIYILGESFLIILGTSIYIYRTTKNVSLSFLIFLCCFFVQSMTAARQYTGIVFAANGIVLLCRNLKNIIGWVLILISVLIHAVIAVVLIGVLGIFLSRKILSAYKLCFISCSIVVMFFFMLDLVLPVVLAVTFPNYAGYLNTAWDQNVLEGQQGYGIGILMLHLLFLFFILVYCKYTTSENCNRLEYAMLPSVSIAAMGVILFHSNMVIPRCFGVFDYLMISFLISCVTKVPNNKYYVLCLILILGVSIGYFRVFLAHDYIFSFY